MNIQPLADRVLVEAAPAEQKLQVVSTFLILPKKSHKKEL